MSHEQSETIQAPDGSWINVYGKATPLAGKQLPGSSRHSTADEAVAEAVARSEAFNSFPSTAGGAAVGNPVAMHKALAAAIRNRK